MPNNIGFFTAVKYAQENKTFRESVLEKVDNYFYLGGKKAHVIQGKTKNGQEKALLAETNSSLLARFGKILSYFTIILPLAMLITKAILRANHTFRLIDPKKKLEKGINISEDTISRIQGLMPKILSGKDDDEIEWLSTGNNLVFKLQANPQLVFKIARPNHFYGNDKLPTGGSEKTNERFENTIKAKEVCVANQLGLLIIPHAKKFNVNAQGNTYTFIAEESLNVNANESSQEHLYHTYSTKLNETARQLAIFIARTGFNDVAWRNIPVLNEPQEYSGPRRVGLIDVEHMKSVVNGFTGDANGSRGLIRCATSEEQIDVIIKEARNQGVAITSKKAQELKQQRLDELKADNQLQQMYKQNGIVTGKEPIQVDVDSLNLDLTEQGQIEVYARDENGKVIIENEDVKWETQTITLRKATEDVIAEINKLIQKSSDAASVKGKRYVVLNTNKDPLRQYNNLGIPSGKFFINEEEEKQLWLRRIIQALVEKGHLFKLDTVNGHGYFIQA
jgi:Family of unknown function (DUF648)